MKRTGIILASGEGSRLKAVSEQLGLPKHLFPIGNQSLLEKTANALWMHCDQILVIVREHEKELFEKEVSKFSFPVEIIVKKEDGFAGDFAATFAYARNESILLTVGDLIFPEGEIERFVKKIEKHPRKLMIAFDRTTFYKFLPDFRMVVTAMPKKMIGELVDLNPESFAEVFPKFLGMLIRNRLRPVFQETLFNINTPQSYQKAKEFFS